MTRRFVTMSNVQAQCEDICHAWAGWCREHGAPAPPGGWRVFGVPRGGVPVAMMIAGMLHGRVVGSPENADLIVDDIYDSGVTAQRYEKYNIPFLVAFDKRHEPWKGQWLVMPWEAIDGKEDHSTDDIGTRLLQALGENPQRGGLVETPKRFLAYMQECTSGMNQDPKALLKVFEDGAENVDEMVVVAGVPFYSLCEHHMAPFFGVAHVAYIPGTIATDIKIMHASLNQDGSVGLGMQHTPKTRIVGLSKIPRLIDMFARRLQVQERLTNQVADTLHKELGALGVGVVLRARHLCMEMRGVRKAGAITYTSAVRGAMKQHGEARNEFLRFVEMADSRMGAL